MNRLSYRPLPYSFRNGRKFPNNCGDVSQLSPLFRRACTIDDCIVKLLELNFCNLWHIFRPGGIGGTVETRLHSYLEIFCHFQNCKAKVCRTNGSKVINDYWLDSLRASVWFSWSLFLGFTSIPGLKSSSEKGNNFCHLFLCFTKSFKLKSNYGLF